MLRLVAIALLFSLSINDAPTVAPAGGAYPSQTEMAEAMHRFGEQMSQARSGTEAGLEEGLNTSVPGQGTITTLPTLKFRVLPDLVPFLTAGADREPDFRTLRGRVADMMEIVAAISGEDANPLEVILVAAKVGLVLDDTLEVLAPIFPEEPGSKRLIIDLKVMAACLQASASWQRVDLIADYATVGAKAFRGLDKTAIIPTDLCNGDAAGQRGERAA